MISGDVIRGYVDMLVLFLLLERDSYGYELSRQIEARTGGAYVIKETTLYSAFARLEKKGCVDPYHGGETFGKRRTYYRITNAGREYYRDKCREWELTKRVIDRFARQSGDEKPTKGE